MRKLAALLLVALSAFQPGLARGQVNTCPVGGACPTLQSALAEVDIQENTSLVSAFAEVDIFENTTLVSAWVEVDVIPIPQAPTNLVIRPAAIEFDNPATPTPNNEANFMAGPNVPLNVCVVLKNEGQAVPPGTTFNIEFNDGPFGGGTVLGVIPVNVFPPAPGDARFCQLVPAGFPVVGPRAIYVRVDLPNGAPNGNVAETIELTDNVAARAIVIGGTGGIFLPIISVSCTRGSNPPNNISYGGTAFYAPLGQTGVTQGAQVDAILTDSMGTTTQVLTAGHTDINGQYAFQFPSPPAPGLYSTTVTVTDFTGIGTCQDFFIVPSPTLDLACGGLTITPRGASGVNQIYDIRATAFNASLVGAGAFRIFVYVTDPAFVQNPVLVFSETVNAGLAAGQSTAVPLAGPFPWLWGQAGSYPISVRVNENRGQPAEPVGSMGNNNCDGTVVVPPPPGAPGAGQPDLSPWALCNQDFCGPRPTDIGVPDPQIGVASAVSVQVYNRGDAVYVPGVPPAAVQITDGAGYNVSLPLNLAIAPGAFQVVNFNAGNSWTPGALCAPGLVVNVDSMNVVAEKDETNNSTLRTCPDLQPVNISVSGCPLSTNATMSIANSGQMGLGAGYFVDTNITPPVGPPFAANQGPFAGSGTFGLFPPGFVFVAPGQYTVSVTADSPFDRIPEQSVANNTSLPVTFTVAPDGVVDNMVVAPPVENTPTFVSALIRNNGDLATAGFNVALRVDGTLVAGSQQSTNALPPGQTQTLFFTNDTTPGGVPVWQPASGPTTSTLSVVLTPPGAEPECSTANNSASQTLPDLVLFDISVPFNPFTQSQSPPIGLPVPVTVQVANDGGMGLTGYVIKWRVLDSGGNQVYPAPGTLQPFPPAGTTTQTGVIMLDPAFVCPLGAPGNIRIQVRADKNDNSIDIPTNTIAPDPGGGNVPEPDIPANEVDNYWEEVFPCHPPLAELRPVTFALGAAPVRNAPVLLSGSVENVGEVPTPAAQNVFVDFPSPGAVPVPQNLGVLGVGQVVPLPGGLTWTPPLVGNVPSITLRVDPPPPNGLIPELNETNNNTVILMPDLVPVAVRVSRNACTRSNSPPRGVQTAVTVQAQNAVRDSAGITPYSVLWRVRDAAFNTFCGGPTLTPVGSLGGTATLGNCNFDPGAQCPIPAGCPMNIDVQLDNTNMNFAAPDDGVVPEPTENNNFITLAVNVHEPIPDLTASGITLNPAGEPMVGDNVIVSAAYSNSGEAASNQPAPLNSGNLNVVLVVTNPSGGTATIFPDPTNPNPQSALGVSQSRAVTFANWVPGTTGVHTLRVTIDSGQAITECDNANNSTSFQVLVWPNQPDLALTSVGNTYDPITGLVPVGSSTKIVASGRNLGGPTATNNFVAFTSQSGALFRSGLATDNSPTFTAFGRGLGFQTASGATITFNSPGIFQFLADAQLGIPQPELDGHTTCTGPLATPNTNNCRVGFVIAYPLPIGGGGGGFCGDGICDTTAGESCSTCPVDCGCGGGGGGPIPPPPVGPDLYVYSEFIVFEVDDPTTLVVDPIPLETACLMQDNNGNCLPFQVPIGTPLFVSSQVRNRGPIDAQFVRVFVNEDVFLNGQIQNNPITRAVATEATIGDIIRAPGTNSTGVGFVDRLPLPNGYALPQPNNSLHVIRFAIDNTTVNDVNVSDNAATRAIFVGNFNQNLVVLFTDPISATAKNVTDSVSTTVSLHVEDGVNLITKPPVALQALFVNAAYSGNPGVPIVIDVLAALNQCGPDPLQPGQTRCAARYLGNGDYQLDFTPAFGTAGQQIALNAMGQDLQGNNGNDNAGLNVGGFTFAIAAVPTTIFANMADETAVTATLLDAGGQGIPNQTILFSTVNPIPAQIGTSCGTNFFPIQGTTDAQGQFSTVYGRCDTQGTVGLQASAISMTQTNIVLQAQRRIRGAPTRVTTTPKSNVTTMRINNGPPSVNVAGVTANQTFTGPVTVSVSASSPSPAPARRGAPLLISSSPLEGEDSGGGLLTRSPRRAPPAPSSNTITVDISSLTGLEDFSVSVGGQSVTKTSLDEGGSNTINLSTDGPYTLRVEAKDKAENVVLQEVPFNLLQFTAAHHLSTRPRVLVWNALSPTGSPSAADAAQFVNAALGGTSLLMKIDAAQTDFEKDYRSGGYNVYVVITDGAWLTSQIVKEMVESLNLGDGLIIVYTGLGGLAGSGDLLGVNFQSRFSETGPYAVTLTADSFTAPGTITGVGTALKASATTATPVGFISSINGSSDVPVIFLRRPLTPDPRPLGTSITFAFDLVNSGTSLQGDPAGWTAAFQSAVFAAQPSVAEVWPLGTTEIGIEMLAIQTPVTVSAIAGLPAGFTPFEITDGGVFAASTITWSVPLTPPLPRVVHYGLTWPDQTGAHVFTASVSASGGFASTPTISLPDIAVALRSAAKITDDLLAGLNALPVFTLDDTTHRDAAVTRITSVRNRVVINQKDVQGNISDLLAAISDLLLISDPGLRPATSALRLEADRLLKYWQLKLTLASPAPAYIDEALNVLAEAKTLTQSLPVSDFDKAQSQGQLAKKWDTLETKIDTGDLAGAISFLKTDVIPFIQSRITNASSRTAVLEPAYGILAWLEHLGLKSIVISPATASLQVGQKAELDATCLFNDGASQTTCEVSIPVFDWTASPTGVVMVDQFGTLDAVGPGATTLSAELFDEVGKANVTVTGTPALIVSPSSRIVGTGAVPNRTHLGVVKILRDFDGDGLADFVAGDYDNGGQGVYLFYGPKNLSGQVLASQADTIFGRGRDTNVFWTALAVEDINGDGYSDLVMGYPRGASTPSGWQVGRVFIFFGGKRLAPLVRVTDADVIIEDDAKTGHFGQSVSVADVNGDGRKDVIVGAPFVKPHGKVYLYFGQRIVSGARLTTKQPDVELMGEDGTEVFGFQVDAGGDLNNDMLADLVVIARQLGQPAILPEGLAFVFLGRSSWPPTLGSSAADSSMADLDDKAPTAVIVGDVNADSIDDLVTSAGTLIEGNAVIRFGGRFSGTRLELGPDVQIFGETASSVLGSSIEGIGDINNDGMDDFALTDGRADRAFNEAGAAYVFAGRALWPARIDHNEAALIAVGPSPKVFLGRPVVLTATLIAGGYDITGDGKRDLLVGAPIFSLGTDSFEGAVFHFTLP